MNNEPNNHHGAESHIVVRRHIPVTTIHKTCLNEYMDKYVSF